MNEIQRYLFENQDSEYRDFNAKLIPSIDKNKIIGVRTPVIRRYSAKIFSTDAAKDFMKTLPHTYYEEDNLHAFLIEKIKDFDEAITETERFLPYIDNWATCDSFSPGIFKKNRDRLILKIKEWIKSDMTYTVRYAAGMLMRHYLDEDFREEYMKLVSEIKSDEYYVNMMIAWYFATALCKQYSSAVKYIENHSLCDFVHKKAIQKAVESYRITAETKEYLKSLK